jgi:NAD(P)-dependent dehydrogenase (short-subunit alcohol dehydrogenase family)
MDGVAIVTGAAHGIGLATAARLHAAGLSVAAVDVDEPTLMAAPLPDDVLRVHADLADDPSDWLAELSSRLGTPTVLVNNAALMDGRSFLELPMPEVQKNLHAMLLGTWGLTRAVALSMIDTGTRGTIVFTLSLHTHRIRNCPDYSVSKAGLRMLMQELAWELGPHGIRVNAVSPGAIDTWSDKIPNAEDHNRRAAEQIPLRQVGTPDDVARAVEFLVDPEKSGYMNGADLKIDGGLDQYNWLHTLYGSTAADESRRNTSA